mmetsp:Transcript_19742/g.14472  ORF Transcript_19742/g.14472 Transcript_19742/m.14472 type:complete len:83 (-) Transcript_19742:96-344(-)
MGQSHYQQQMDLLQGVGEEAKSVPSLFYTTIEEWLRDRTFENENIPVEVRLTFQQLLFLVIEIPEGFRQVRLHLISYLSEMV